MNNLAFGCSHTYGVGVERYQAWPALLNLKNCGVPGTSTDYIDRILQEKVEENNPIKIFILWPIWTRFEYVHNDRYCQSLPTDSNRILFMEEWTEEKLKQNFSNKQNKIKNFCNEKNIKLIALDFEDLATYIDHADRWPKSKLGHHNAPIWHKWVADIFLRKENEQT
jgi:hypothetical protein